MLAKMYMNAPIRAELLMWCKSFCEWKKYIWAAIYNRLFAVSDARVVIYRLAPKVQHEPVVEHYRRHIKKIDTNVWILT